MSVGHIIIIEIVSLLIILILVGFPHILHLLNFQGLLIFLSVFPFTLNHSQLGVRFRSLSCRCGPSGSKYCTILRIIGLHHFLNIVWLFGLLNYHLLSLLFLHWEVIIIESFKLWNRNNLLFYRLVKLYI